MLRSNNDFAAQIVGHFLHLKQKGSAVNAIDQQLIMRWESSQIPLQLILQGIDDAFAKLVKPPYSLSQCGKFVNQLLKKKQNLKKEPAENKQKSVETISPQKIRPLSTEQRLRAAARRTKHPVFERACSSLADEIKTYIEEGGSFLDESQEFLDEALIEKILAEFEETKRTQIVNRAEVLFKRNKKLAVMSEKALQKRRVKAKLHVLSKIEPWPL